MAMADSREAEEMLLKPVASPATAHVGRPGFDNQNRPSLPPLPPQPQQLYPASGLQDSFQVDCPNGVYVTSPPLVDQYDQPDGGSSSSSSTDAIVNSSGQREPEVSPSDTCIALLDDHISEAARHHHTVRQLDSGDKGRKDESDDESMADSETDDVGRKAKKLERKRETLMMRDDTRRIDFVLVYRQSTDKTRTRSRKYFERNLIDEGLELERDDRKYSQDQQTYFLKIHAPWDYLARMAELMALKMPLVQDYNKGLAAPAESFLSNVPNPFQLPENLVPAEANYFTAHFTRDRESIFHIPDRDTFFTNAQRSRMVYETLLRTRYDEADTEKIGVDRLLRHGIFTGAFPLHEGKYKNEHSILAFGPSNDRHLLYEAWARPSRWYCYQPLDLIRKYFGEQIGIYFAWLGFYTAMLIPASIVGLIVFVYGAGTLFKNVPSEEICDLSRAGNLTMCPLCDERCSYWRLHTSCLYSRLTYLFDNSATVFFAGFMAIWATTFLEFWKRKQAEIQYDWDMSDFDMEEHMRPEFEAKVHHRKLNPITELMEPFLPLWSKIPRRCNSIIVIMFMIFCVLVAVFGVIMYRIIIVAIFYASGDKLIRENAKLMTTATAALINLAIIMLLNKVYQRIALWLTNLEHPRTDSEFNDSFTFKMFFFQFINFYSSIFYIAFFKGRLGGRPGSYNYKLMYRAEECDPAGCLIELCIQLGIVMIGKQAFNNFKEVMLPKILNWLRARGAKQRETLENLYTRCEQDHDLQSISTLCLFEEYLEMVIQYGFVTIFVAAFPLAPLFALINNIIEIRLDAYKFVTQWQRPVAYRAQDIGIWFGILQSVSFIAVLSNAFIIGWTSEFMPKLVYQLAISESGTLAGYINHSLSYFDINDFQNRSQPHDNRSAEFGVVELCRYSDYRYSPDAGEALKYTYTTNYWHITVGRLAFIIAFEHIVFFLSWLVTYLIPDVPAEVRQLMLREHHLVKESRYVATLPQHVQKKRQKKSGRKAPV